MAINGTLRSPRRRLAMLGVVLALSGGVVAAHTGLGMDHMGDGQAVCVAVIESALAVALVTSAARPLRRRRAIVLVRFTRPTPSRALPPPAPRARAGPPLLQVFRL